MVVFEQRPAAGVAQSIGASTTTSMSLYASLPGLEDLPTALGGPLISMKSHLETTSISLPTQTGYTESVTGFINLCQRWNLDWATDEELNAIVVYVLDYMYFDNQPSHLATRLVAGLRWFAPRFRRGGAGHLPRAIVALNAFARRRPGQQRLPLPWVVVCAVIGMLMHAKEIWMALQVTISFGGICVQARATDCGLATLSLQVTWQEISIKCGA